MQFARKLRATSLFLHLTCWAAAFSLLSNAATAQPAGRVITIVVPFAAAGGTNVLARLLGEELQRRLGQPVAVDNKPGASGNIGAQIVARAAPDGQTLLLTVDPPFTANASLMKNIPYEPARSFAPIVELATGTMALAVHSSIPVTSAEAFIAYVKSRPEHVNYGSAGVGTPHHLTMELLKLTAQANLAHVPFRDTAGLISNLVGGHIGAAFLPLNVALPLPQDKVRTLAVTARKRVAAAPGLPTFIEQGFAEFESDIRFGLLVPAGTPRDLVVRYNAMANEILAEPQFATKLVALGLIPVGGTPERYGEAIAKDQAKWQKVVKGAGITAE